MCLPILHENDYKFQRLAHSLSMRIDGCALEECQFPAQMRAVGAMVHKKFNLSGHSLQALVVALVALMAGTACQSSAPTTTQVAAAPTALEVTVEDPDNPEAPQARATYPDGYPNFAGSLNAANVQLSNDEATALQAQLTSLGAARQSGSISEAAYQARLAELRKLAAQHGPETQALIAN
ncbi:MAG: SHOCT domain-containing protein [Agrobacterium albertimagni]